MIVIFTIILFGLGVFTIILGFIDSDINISLIGALFILLSLFFAVVAKEPNSLKQECEKNLPRSQECVLQYVPAPVK